MDQLITFVRKITELDAAATQELLSVLKFREYAKGEWIASPSRVCRHLYFLEQGLVKLYFHREGKEVILRFFPENTMFTSLESFLTQRDTSHQILALEPSRVYYLSKSDLELLCQKHHSVERFYRLFLSMASVNMLHRVSELLSNDASLRYDHFLAENAELLQRISLGDLANYLGITQVSLSRIRARK